MSGLVLACRYAGTNRRESRRRPIELLEMVGLGHRLNHRPDQLSGRAAAAGRDRVRLVKHPALVLCDEPTGAVDSQTSDELVALMRTLNRDEGVTFLIVTHDLDLAAKTDRVIRLKDGRVVSDECTSAPLEVVATA